MVDQIQNQVRMTSRGPISVPVIPVRNMQRLIKQAMNKVWSREQWTQGQGLDDRREINDECGYPETGGIDAVKYQDMYDREPISARVVEVFPSECWSVLPEVLETEDAEVVTPFEQAWKDLPSNIGMKTSWFKGSEANPIYDVLKRADILSGIGSYGVIILGLDDGLDLQEPVEGINEDGSASEAVRERRLLYLRAIPESLAQITTRESDVTNPRYGRPTMYDITFESPHNNQTQDPHQLENMSTKVHWTRVIHIADNLGSSEVFGTPRMQSVYNRLYDLRKLYAGSAEMYWRGAFPGISFETIPQLGGDVEIDESRLKDQMEQYMNGLQRYFSTSGMTANSLAPQVVDPTSQIEVQIDAICIRIGIPKRIFMGSERGELASSQDMKTWNRRVMERHNCYITPRILCPFIDRLIQVGVLPVPGEKGYSVKWPDLNTLSEQEQAQVALTRTDAFSKYIQGSVEALIPPLEYLTEIVGMDMDQVEEILKSAMDSEEPLTLELGVRSDEEDEGTEEVQTSEDQGTEQVV